MKHVDHKLWWFYHHIGAMCGAFLAALTAFLVNAVGPHISQYSFSWTVWILPTIIGAPGIVFWIRYYKKQHGFYEEKEAMKGNGMSNSIGAK